jgi:phosphoglucosamine mutase
MTDRPRLFGTDGVRGTAGEYPLDRETVAKLGSALATVLAREVSARPLRVLLGEDTRESSASISRRLTAGLQSKGVEVVYGGVITTPGVAFLTRLHGFTAGVMVSASHNPYQDNGIKVLSGSGTKLSESVELEIERALDLDEAGGPDEQARPLETESAIEPDPALMRDYVDHLVSLVPDGNHVSRARLVFDCANGAACRVVPELVKRLGIQARIIHAEPDGRNINLGCGSLYPETMAEETKSQGADLGVAFDGDADRAIFSTREGRIADGDHVLFATAPYFKRRAALKGDAVVGTLMTNLGLELALAQQGIGLKRTAVGDKYVLEEMLRSGINLGGEPSGHVIFSDISLAGDGIITLLQVLRVLAETGQSLGELVRGLKQFPQIIRNVPVKEKRPLESIPEVARAVARFRRELGDRGRAVVRYSGTEPLARVMVEADDARAVERHAALIAEAIESALGNKSGDTKKIGRVS